MNASPSSRLGSRAHRQEEHRWPGAGHSAVEEFRSALAMDLHDDLGPELLRISLLCHRLLLLSELPPGLRTTLERMALLSRNANASLHDIVWGLRRETSDSCISTRLRTIAGELLSDAGLESHLHFPDAEVVIPVRSTLHTGLPMVLKETLCNAIDHARARRVSVSFVQDHGRFTLAVADDGNGFAVKTPPCLGHGLRNMRERAAAMGATCTIRSTPGAGCEVVVRGVLA